MCVELTPIVHDFDEVYPIGDKLRDNFDSVTTISNFVLYSRCNFNSRRKETASQPLAWGKGVGSTLI